MNNNTKQKRWKGKPNVYCTFCGDKFYKYPSKIKQSKSGNHFCSTDCRDDYNNKVFFDRLRDEKGIENFEEWLDYKYHVEKMNARDIAEIVYGKKTHSPNILGWMRKFEIDTRERSEAVALQWLDNPERREAQSTFAKSKLIAGTPGRNKLIEIMQTEEYRLKQSITKTGERNGMFGITGEEHPMWNPELTNEDRAKKRNTPEYEKWRMEVYRKDNYTCQCCKDKKGGNLVAHHLNGYNWDVENRYNPENGVTLCEDCHIEFHRTYGFGNNTRRQFGYFQKNINPKEYKEQLALF